MKFPMVLAASFIVIASPALAKECRIPDPKPGQPIQVPAECKETFHSRMRKSDALKGEPGVIDLGYSTTLQISGRARAEMGVRR
jgi:hypothetical protein